MLPSLYKLRCDLISYWKKQVDVLITGHSHYTEEFKRGDFTYYTAAIMDANSYITIKGSEIKIQNF